MNMTPGELADKYAILRLKRDRLPQDKALLRELEEVTCAIHEEQGNYEQAQILRTKLYVVNGQIWDLEAEIRAGNDGSITLEEIGRRALAIRNFNKGRVALKNQMNDLFGAPKEIKVDHASA